jgi:hypothetical protein
MLQPIPPIEPDVLFDAVKSTTAADAALAAVTQTATALSSPDFVKTRMHNPTSNKFWPIARRLSAAWS